MSLDSVSLPASVLERLTGVLERIEKRLGHDASPGTNGLLTITEVADRLQKSRRDVERLVRAGTLKKVPNLGKRTTRFRPADVDRMLADQAEQPGRRRL